MGTFVAVLGAAPPQGLRGSAPWGSWAVLPWSDPAVLATEPEVRSAETDRLLVVTPAAGARPARVAAAAVAAVRRELPVRVEVRHESTAVLLRAVESVPPGVVGANHVAAVVGRLADRSVWGGWLPSVAKLERPAPTLGQHVRSWFLRGAGFLAVHGEPGWVERLPLDQVDQSRRLPRAQDYDAQMFGSLPEDAIAALFSLGLTGRPVRREPLGDAGDVWGTPQAVEFVVLPLPGEPYRSADALVGPAKGTCPVCTEPVWGPCCTYCRAVPVGTRDIERTTVPPDPATGPTPGGQG